MGALVTKIVLNDRWKKEKTSRQKKRGTQVCGNVYDRSQQNCDAMKNYLTKNQESHLKIEIIQIQIEDLESSRNINISKILRLVSRNVNVSRNIFIPASRFSSHTHEFFHAL
jgi:hypothetical protein